MSLGSLNRRALIAMGDVAMRFANNNLVRALNEGLINLIPIVLIGSICTAITNLPFPLVHTVLNDLTANHWTLVSQMVTYATADVITLAAMLSVSMAIAEQSPFVHKREISIFIPVFTTLACYILFFVWDQASFLATPDTLTPEVLFANVGGRGVFYGLFVAVVATELFIAFGKLWQRWRNSRPRTVYANYQLRIAMRSVFPMALTVAVFVVMRLVADWLFDVLWLDDMIFDFMARTVNDGSFASVLLTEALMQVLWFFGAHGADTMQSLLLSGGAGYSGVPAVSEVMVNYVPQLHSTVANADFYSNFVDLGGSGATFGMLIALFIFGSAARGRRVARISVFPSLFNVNETIIYGLPMVLNPFTLIPFMLAPVCIAAVSYGAFALGLVPPIVASVDWTTPILFSGFLATGSFAGVLLQLLCLGISVAFYAPCVLITRDATERQQKALYGQFKTEAAKAANNEQATLMNRRDGIGTMTREFIAEIYEHFDSGNLPFFMVFQPKTNKLGEVAGAEALLRWTHPRFGPIPPDIVIELTDEAGVTTEFGRWITTASLEEFARWRGYGINSVLLSINLNPHHLFVDAEFPAFLDAELTRLEINRSLIELEITEHVAVGSNEDMRQMFSRLRALGVGLSIDDMGMGYSSLTYISDFGVGTVKVDISLIDKVDTDYQQQEIVRSVVELATSLDLAVIVEGVEKRAQVDTLVDLGCRFFQGYYFSKPLPASDFIDFVAQHGETRLLHTREEIALEAAIAAASAAGEITPPVCLG